MVEYTNAELMITRSAKTLHNDDTVLVGVGIPNLACNLAKSLHAPELEMIYESGVVGSNPSELPLSIGDPALVSNTRSLFSLRDVFGYYIQAGRIDVGFLGGAQIDRQGNINSTVIGDYDAPDVRLPGSGGACEIASNSHRTIVVSPHTERRFPPEVDFITSPGYVGDRQARKDLGLNGGPALVITDKAVMGFDDAGTMYVKTLHPGITEDEVRDATGWDIAFADGLERTPAPTRKEIDLIRNDLDPAGLYNETEA